VRRIPLVALTGTGFAKVDPNEHYPPIPKIHRARPVIVDLMGTPTAPENRQTPFPVQGAVALVTGANRGLGKLFTRELINRGAAKVYAGARKPQAITDGDVVPVGLDITDATAVAAAAQRCDDVTLLINNAGTFRPTSLLAAGAMSEVRAEMETDFFGTLAMVRAFAPILGRNGGGAIVNSLSVLSFSSYAPWGAYGAAKAAAWSMSNSARDELREQGTRVLNVHAGLADTDMTAGLDFPKIDPHVFVVGALDALEAGQFEALVDEHTRGYKANLAGYPANAPAY
jgi:NAD(P)-dependent dehydrogenase (short-subunit alcohol dehydrogenase family)